MVDFIVEEGPCGSPLRQCAFLISIFCLLTAILSGVFILVFLIYTTTLGGFFFLGSICLFLGALLENHWLVLIWLINAFLYFIFVPFAFIGIIFDYGGYREAAFSDNVYIILAEYIIELLIVLYLTRLVYSYFVQLRSTQDNQQ